MRGHALSMKAIPGGKATHDPLDAHTMAAWRRGGMLPQASVDPAQRRATRDRWRRRTPLRRTRAELWAHVQQTPSPDHLPAIGQQLADQAKREGVAQRWADPAGHQRIAVDWALSPDDDQRRGARERSRLHAATPPEAHTRSRVPTGPGRGQLLRRGRLDAIHAMARFPSGQALVS